MSRKIDLSPFFGKGVDPDLGQARWDALPYRRRRWIVFRLVKAFAKKAGIQPKKGGQP
jgi:hypothetical protein